MRELNEILKDLVEVTRRIDLIADSVQGCIDEKSDIDTIKIVIELAGSHLIQKHDLTTELFDNKEELLAQLLNTSFEYALYFEKVVEKSSEAVDKLVDNMNKLTEFSILGG